jgi:glutamate-1-semialdehyde 2,1-aminomutase
MAATPAAIAREARAVRVSPGGVHSPVRAFKAMGMRPLVIAEAHGAHVTDLDGRQFVDWIGGWGPALLGHDHPAIAKAIVAAVSRGVVFGLASSPEVELSERIAARVPGCEMVRLVVTGTEATMTAVRVARAATGRARLIKFAGGYHGHADMFLVSAGSGAATIGVPDSPGVTAGTAADTVVADFNDLASVDGCFDRYPGEIAALIVEPVMGNMGCVPPAAGFLQALRERSTRHGAVLIFDEVMTGFRVARGGAAERYGVTPDLVTLGKVAGGGLPLAAFGGRRDLMTLVAPAGPVYQAGTYAAHPLAVAAGLAAFDAIDATPDLYDSLERSGETLEWSLQQVIADVGVAAIVQRVGSMWTLFFSNRPVRSWADAAGVDRAAYVAFFQGMLARGVLLPPSPFESAFLSMAHDQATIAQTVEAARVTLQEMAR